MVCGSLKVSCSRFRELVRFPRHQQKQQQKKRSLEISSPFNFQKLDGMFPDYEDEISILREKAMASQIGIADHDSVGELRPRRAPPMPSRVASSTASSMAPSSPVSSKSTLI